MTPVQRVDGRVVTTVEGLDAEVREAWGEALCATGGSQCGFCTPGFIVAVHHLLENNPNPSDDEIRESLSGNICRCTGYGRILEAVRTVADQRRTNS